MTEHPLSLHAPWTLFFFLHSMCKQKQRLFLFPTSTHRGTIPDVCKAPTPLLRTSKMHLQRNYKGRGHDMLRGGLKIANVGPFFWSANGLEETLRNSNLLLPRVRRFPNSFPG